MRSKVVTTGFLVFLAVLRIVFSAEKPDYSGSWALDKERSFSNPPGFDQAMKVTHNVDVVKLEGKQTTAKGETAVSETYTLDGKEADFTPAGGSPGAKGKRKSFWLADGRSFVVNDTITTESPSGTSTQQVIRKWQLSSDGSLVIDYYFDGPRGQGESKRVFVRKP